MTDISTTEPIQFTAGDTVRWCKFLEDYLAGDGWVVTYALRGASVIDLTAAASGDDHLITITAAESAEFAAGNYWWQSYATKAGERFQVDTGNLTIKENLAAATTFDGRSHVKKVLDALEATIAGKASRDQLSYSIAGRSLSRMSAEDVITWRDKYRAEYQQEVKAEKIRKGLGNNSIIRVRF